MIKVLAIDDEPLALKQLSAYIRKIPFFELVAECQNAIEARDVMNRELIDAIFCDINMPDLSGMDFVRQLAVRPLIVFTTAYSEYAIEGYKVDAVDYLLKPFGLNEFQRAALKVKDLYDLRAKSQTPVQERPESDIQATDDTIFVKTDYRMVRISISDICYIEAMSEYLKLHLESQPKPVITLLSMKKIEEFLPDNFMRIHRSYIVNLDKVTEVNKNRVILAPPHAADSRQTGQDINLPISENYKEQFQQYLDTRYLGK